MFIFHIYKSIINVFVNINYTDIVANIIKKTGNSEQ